MKLLPNTHSASGQRSGLRYGIEFVVVGALLFTASLLLERHKASDPDADLSTPQPPVVVSATRLDQARDTFLAQRHRAPSDEELAAIVEHLVNEEILFRHALDLGMDRQDPVQRRLAQIATFVSDDPPQAASWSPEETAAETANRAAEAMRLGLHHDDVVIRRILVDSARRLIRGAVLVREPTEQALRDHLAQHPERFQLPEAIALDWSYDPAGNDQESVPLLTTSDLERRFGRDFVSELDLERVGEWQGPLDSRNGRIHVRITSHLPERTADLDEVRRQVRHEVAEILADRWLETRLGQLRDGVEVQLPQDRNLPTLADLRLFDDDASVDVPRSAS